MAATYNGNKVKNLNLKLLNGRGFRSVYLKDTIYYIGISSKTRIYFAKSGCEMISQDVSEFKTHLGLTFEFIDDDINNLLHKDNYRSRNGYVYKEA